MKIKPNMIKKGIRCLKQYGPREFMIRASEHLKSEEVPYGPWFETHRLKEEEWHRQREDAEHWKKRPLVSICVPLYQTPEKYLCEMIDSVKNQTYSNWQLCLADGTKDGSVEQVIKSRYSKEPRIRYEHLKENLGIAENTNAAFALADGAWIGLLDHDDILAPEALYEVLAAAGVSDAAASVVERTRNNQASSMAGRNQEAKEADVVYTDEDKVTMDLGEHFQPHFKPDFNPDLLCSNNYITHFFVVRREIVERVGGFRREYDGSQDYDFIFRCTDAAERIVHVPRILYHWRTSANSTADNPASKMYAYEAGKRAIEEHLRTKGIAAEVLHTKSLGFYRVKYQLTDHPLISIVVVNTGGEEALDRCLNAIAGSSYENYEVIVVEKEEGAGLAARYNRGVSRAKGEYVVLLDGCITFLTHDWLEELAGHCGQEGVAAAGCKLLYPDGTLWHAGIVVGNGEIANNVFMGMNGDYYGYMHRAGVQMNYSAVSYVCMMVKKSIFDEMGGLTEELAAWSDVDFGLRLGQAGYRLVYTPYASARYGISKQPKTDKALGCKEAAAYMKAHWAEILEAGDPCYNPNFSREKADYCLAERA